MSVKCVCKPYPTLLTSTLVGRLGKLLRIFVGVLFKRSNINFDVLSIFFQFIIIIGEIFNLFFKIT